MNIHTFGDSHAMFAWNRVQLEGVEIHIHHLGPKLMYSVGRDGLAALDISAFGVQDGDTVVMSFGEVDCRSHVHKLGEIWEAAVDSTVEKFMEVVDENTCSYRDLTTCIYNVLPPVERENSPENPEFPFRGSDIERRSYVQRMNCRLRECCASRGWVFVDVFDKYANSSGFLDSAYSDGHVHIVDPSHLQAFLSATVVRGTSLR